MMLSYTLLVVPVYDVVRVSLVRLSHGAPIFQADKNHIHHKLMRSGLNQHQALICILSLAVAYTLLNLILWQFCTFSVIILIDIIVWMLFHYILNQAITRHGNQVYLANTKTPTT